MKLSKNKMGKINNLVTGFMVGMKNTENEITCSKR